MPKVLAEIVGPQLMHAAAVLYCTIDERDFVGVLMTAECRFVPGDPVSTRSILEVWSPAGGSLHKLWEVRGNQVRICTRTDNAATRRVDFGAADFVVDLQVDNHLAKRGFPGAIVRRGGWEPAFELDPWPEGAAFLSFATGNRRWPWESARTYAVALEKISIGAAMASSPVARRPVSAALAQVSPWQALHDGPYADEEVLGFTTLYSRDSDLVETARALVVHPCVTPRLRMTLLAYGITAAAETGQPGSTRMAPPLIRACHAELDRAGGPGPWVREQWPERLGVADTIGPCVIASMATGLGYQAALARTPEAVVAAIERLDALRDAFLDRAGAPGGTPGDRVVAFVRRATRSSTGTETRYKRFAERIMASEPEAEEHFLEVAALHAMTLHSQSVILAAILGTGVLGGQGTAMPYELDLTGVFDEARAALARLAVVGAMRYVNDAPDLSLELLEFAADQAAFEPFVTSCANEGRFRLGVRSPALLATLDLEPPALARLAESLTVAEALGSPRRGALARQLAAASTTGEPTLRWAAAIRAMAFSPEPMAEIERVRGFLRARPSSFPKVCPDSRAAYALYGAEPERTANAWVRRLEAQEASLIEAAALRSERIEDLLTRPPPPRKERPPVPNGAAPGAVEEALAALRWRLSRPAAANLALHKALYAHARAALELQAAQSEGPTDIADWLAALGTAEIGVVPALDAFLRGADASAVEAALGLANEALARAISAAWLTRATGQVRQIGSALADAGPEVRSQVDALRTALGAARVSADFAVARLEVDAEIAALHDVIAERRRTPVEPAAPAMDDDSGGEGDSFRPMEITAHAIGRSRADLGTPEWAVRIGLRQIDLYNESRGRRDLKKLQGTPAGDGALWELRHHDSRHPVRVLWRFQADGPRASR